MKLKAWQKNLLIIICIIIGGFVLLNLAFIITSLLVQGTMWLLQLDPNQAPPLAIFFVPAIFFGGLTWLILQSQLPHVWKATYLVLPLMIVLVVLGVMSSLLSWLTNGLVVGIGALFLTFITAIVYWQKLPWMYYLTIAYVAILGLSIIIFNIEI